jgi:hypothetical protein
MYLEDVLLKNDAEPAPKTTRQRSLCCASLAFFLMRIQAIAAAHGCFRGFGKKSGSCRVLVRLTLPRKLESAMPPTQSGASAPATDTEMGQRDLRLRRRGPSTKRNAFDAEYTRIPPTLGIDDEPVRHSLNKQKRWTILDDPAAFAQQNHIELSVVTHQHLSKHDAKNGRVYGVTDRAPTGYGGGQVRWQQKCGRNYCREAKYGSSASESFNIRLPMRASEYPLFREYRSNFQGPCQGCFRSQGRIWQLRGTGNKSLNKTKGMRRLQAKTAQPFELFR